MGEGEITMKSLQTRVHALYKLIKSNATFANKFCMNVAYIKCKTRIHTYTYTQAHTLYIKGLKKTYVRMGENRNLAKNHTILK